VARSKSRRWVQLDHRKRIAIGQFARHDMYLLTVDERNVITLTPADVVAVDPAPIKPRTPRKRASQKRAAAAAGETSPEQGRTQE
jgi:hypothetical protein